MRFSIFHWFTPEEFRCLKRVYELEVIFASNLIEIVESDYLNGKYGVTIRTNDQSLLVELLIRMGQLYEDQQLYKSMSYSKPNFKF